MNIKVLKGRTKIVYDVAKRLPDVDEWMEYMWKNMYVGIEYELLCDGRPSNGTLREEFGMPQTPYHKYLNCDNCDLKTSCTSRGRYGGCHEFFRENLIVSIQDDVSLGHGSEFLLHTGTMSTQQFIKRLPIRKFSDYGYHASRSGSIHVHLVIPYFKRNIPIVILENFWSLFKYYYCGIAYVTGVRQGYCLRNTEYSRFVNFTRTLTDAIRRCVRSGINFANMKFRNNHQTITKLDLEIRTYDTSLNVNHVALIRFLTRILWMRAVEISGIGRYILRSTNEWMERKKIIGLLNRHHRFRKPNSHRYVTGEKKQDEKMRDIMKDVAEELYFEIEHLMTDYEKELFKEFIDKPIWLNLAKLDCVEKKKANKIAEFDMGLICLVKTKTVSAKTRKTYYEKVAKIMDSTVDYVRTRLSKISGRWNKETGCYTIKSRSDGNVK